jgi:hypothetical protein
VASNPISNTWSLTKIRIRLAMRNKMFLFFSLLMPMIFLFLFATLWGKGSPEKINFILGGILTLTVMGGFWGLSVQLVSFRELGILRRFRLAPLGSGSWWCLSYSLKCWSPNTFCTWPAGATSRRSFCW